MNKEIQELKARIRTEMKNRLLKMVPTKVLNLSNRIAELLFSTKEWKEASLIFIYKALQQEVQTEPIIQAAFREKKRVCVPVFKQEEKSYGIALIDEKTLFKKGYYDIEEPLIPNWLKPEEKISIAIVPGLAFDIKGTRLGRGKGFYDRLLKLDVCRLASKIGLFFHFQQADIISATSNDVPLDLVITDKKIFRFNNIVENKQN